MRLTHATCENCNNPKAIVLEIDPGPLVNETIGLVVCGGCEAIYPDVVEGAGAIRRFVQKVEEAHQQPGETHAEADLRPGGGPWRTARPLQ